MNISTLPTAISDVSQHREKAKGYLRRSAFFVRYALGIRENTRMTVTLREELFANGFPFEDLTAMLFSTGAIHPSFYLQKRENFFKKEIFL